MSKTTPLILMLTLVLAGCNKSPGTSATAAPAGGGSNAASGNGSGEDPVEKKLMEIAGSGAANCGHLKSQAPAEMDAAGKCVMQDAQQKKPFFVAYELPGMTVAIAGNAEGKLFSLQTQASAPGGLSTVPCPNELRIAPSGRATCYAPGTFPMGTDASHGGMMSLPSGINPHKGSGDLPPGHPNPHQQPNPHEQKPAPPPAKAS